MCLVLGVCGVSFSQCTCTSDGQLGLAILLVKFGLEILACINQNVLFWTKTSHTAGSGAQNRFIKKTDLVSQELRCTVHIGRGIDFQTFNTLLLLHCAYLRQKVQPKHREVVVWAQTKGLFGTQHLLKSLCILLFWVFLFCSYLPNFGAGRNWQFVVSHWWSYRTLHIAQPETSVSPIRMQDKQTLIYN